MVHEDVAVVRARPSRTSDGVATVVGPGRRRGAGSTTPGRYVEQAPTAEELAFDLVQVDGRVAHRRPARRASLVSEVDARPRAHPVRGVLPRPDRALPRPRRPLVPAADLRRRPRWCGPCWAGRARRTSAALGSAAPGGTRLDLPTVPVVDGVATVDLTDEVLLADQRGARPAAGPAARDAAGGARACPASWSPWTGRRLDEPQAADDARRRRRWSSTPASTTARSSWARPRRTTEGPTTPGPPAAGPRDAGRRGRRRDRGPDRPDGGRPAAAVGAGDAAPRRPAAGAATRRPAGGSSCSATTAGRSPRTGPVVLRLEGAALVPVEGTEALAAEVATGLAVAQDLRHVRRPGRGPPLAVGAAARRAARWSWSAAAASSSPPASTRRRSAGSGRSPRASPGPGAVPTVVAAAASSVGGRGPLAAARRRGARAARQPRRGPRARRRRPRRRHGVGGGAGGPPRRQRAGRCRCRRRPSGVAAELTDAVDASWVDDDQVVVLGRVGEEAVRPVLSQVGGTTERAGPDAGRGLGERGDRGPEHRRGHGRRHGPAPLGQPVARRAARCVPRVPRLSAVHSPARGPPGGDRARQAARVTGGATAAGQGCRRGVRRAACGRAARGRLRGRAAWAGLLLPVALPGLRAARRRRLRRRAAARLLQRAAAAPAPGRRHPGRRRRRLARPGPRAGVRGQGAGPRRRGRGAGPRPGPRRARSAGFDVPRRSRTLLLVAPPAPAGAVLRRADRPTERLAGGGGARCCGPPGRTCGPAGPAVPRLAPGPPGAGPGRPRPGRAGREPRRRLRLRRRPAPAAARRRRAGRRRRPDHRRDARRGGRALREARRPRGRGSRRRGGRDASRSWTRPGHAALDFTSASGSV